MRASATSVDATFSPFQRKGVADAVDKEEIAGFIVAHQVAGAEPGVAGLEHIAHDLALRFVIAGVALEPIADGRLVVGDEADRLADLVDSAAQAEAAFVAVGLTGRAIEPDSRDSVHGVRGTAESGRSHRFALELEQRDVALGGGVELAAAVRSRACIGSVAVLHVI